jgi:hypothetical protein
MTYSVDDITELIRHHLLLSDDDNDRTVSDLLRLTANIAELMHEPLKRQPGWVVCEGCGAWVGTELIGPNGAGYTLHGVFNCSDCRWGLDQSQ